MMTTKLRERDVASAEFGQPMQDIEISHGDLSQLLDLALTVHEYSAALLHALEAFIPQDHTNASDRPST
jgi:hypothetical protein